MLKIIKSESFLLIVLVALAFIIQSAAQLQWIYIVAASLLLLVATLFFASFDYFIGRRFSARFPWLHHLLGEEGLPGIHKSEGLVFPGSHVYLVSPDLYNDANNRGTINLVLSNLKRGVKYYYIIPDDKEAILNARIARRNFDNFSHLVNIYVIPDLFSKAPLLSNVLLLQSPDLSGQPDAFLELPFVQNERRLYWVKTDKATAKRWFELIVKLIEDAPTFQYFPAIADA